VRWHFENYVLDAERRQLLLEGAEVHLSPKAFRLLEILIESEPRALSKKELYDGLWPDTFVTESNLAGLVRELRDALSDRNRTARFIRTVHRFGYAFAVHASPTNAIEPPRKTHYRLVWDNREIVLDEGETVLGRDPDATVRIDHPTVSRHHARIFIEGEIATIEDLDSKNGTQVSGQKVVRRFSLSNGDHVELGSVKMTFRAGGRTPSTLSVSALKSD
jgi:DNA-binding winged helix-turn-helix (wHTH) protein